ncbi:hypothetical protein [Idiomarina baltica]|uniref:Orphan protein n=1 Tax=Idiomarina baltica OS145 TaxID=314276 RepID=A0ABM9WQN5_9GAMM|nr:hypothetical protein [Idiomarina baltica]EAQ33291.1 hypothetical protein OS145_02945 [Idiomarina baltica OS145]
MSTYLLINSDTLLAKQFVKTIRPSDDAVWELHFAEASVTEERNNEAPHLSVCDPEDDWRLNYELERAFLEFGYFDDVILFPGALKFGAIEAIPSRTINEQVSRQITSVIEIYRILADKLRSHKSCHITQFLYEESYEFSALSSLPLAINGAIRGFVSGLRKELSQLNVTIDVKPLKSVYIDFTSEEYSFFNDLELTQYQTMVNRYLKDIGNVFDGRERNGKL